MSGVGVCPKHPDGHVWAASRVDPLRSCVHCGLHGREPQKGYGRAGAEGGGFFAEATAARSERFSGLKAGMQSGTGKVERG